MINNIAPVDYERYAVLASQLLVPGPMPTTAHAERTDLTQLGPGNPARPRNQTNHDLNKEPLGYNIPLHKNRHVFRLKSVPFTRPDPETGRGQKVDFFA